MQVRWNVAAVGRIPAWAFFKGVLVVLQITEFLPLVIEHPLGARNAAGCFVMLVRFSQAKMLFSLGLGSVFIPRHCI